MKQTNCLHAECESCVFCERTPVRDAAARTLAVISGVGPDEPITEDASGYRSAESPYRMDLMPGKALLHLSAIMKYGAEGRNGQPGHGENNWKNGSVEKHINKCLVHLFAHLAGDSTDDHLGHAAWRAMAALEIHLASKNPHKDGNVGVTR